MDKIRSFLVKQIREIILPFIFFFFLFHLVALTRAVSRGDYSISGLGGAYVTVVAYIVAKAILVVEALPIARRFSGRLIFHVLWKTLLFSALAILFRLIEELVPLIVKYGSVLTAIRALNSETSWPLFAVLLLWVIGGLFLYCLASELVGMLGAEKVKEMLFGTRGTES